MSTRAPDEDLPDEVVVETDDGIVEVDDDDVEDGALEEESTDDSDDSDAEPDDEADLVDEGLPDDELEESLENETEFASDADVDRDEIDIRTPLTEPDALVSRLRLIGEQPLAERAESLMQLHDELRARLESGDPTPR